MSKRVTPRRLISAGKPNRRGFLKGAAALALLPVLESDVAAQRFNAFGVSGPVSGGFEWGGPVLDFHHHYRNPMETNLAHMNGAGITRSLLLTDTHLDEDAAALMALEPDRFARFTSTNVAPPEDLDQALERLRTGIFAGAVGLGEMKSGVDLDGPEMRAVYGVAHVVGKPVLMHFQEVTQPLSKGTFNRGFDRFDKVLIEWPDVNFIGHADNFWANISKDVSIDTAYPIGPVVPGGLTDQYLSRFPNLYGDLSATSGRNALARDPEFARDFLDRHQDKLVFGSDCFCADGHGKGQSNPLPLITGKCVARETLTALKELTTPEVFRKITWENGNRLLRLDPDF